MFEYELQQIRAAEMIRAADDYRMAREAVRTRRAARHEAARSGHHDGEGRVNGHRPRRPRFARAA
ncbi:hypothetical protein ACH4Y0_28475 [Streptomyces sp. NPDC020707]|uniref:Uncharacterized protein n=1 Tax=Streptomyces ortus TaxID=2867268 RepID=A0ABT3V7G6_9ACTN|nr:MULTISPECIES: hypothetical protein [Streptomyces]MCX4234600.1 hypothetical protein [Streptomyces ortus]